MSVDVFLNQILSLTFLWSVFVDAFMVTNDTTLLRVDVCLVKIQISLTLVFISELTFLCLITVDGCLKNR